MDSKRLVQKHLYLDPKDAFVFNHVFIESNKFLKVLLMDLLFLRKEPEIHNVQISDLKSCHELDKLFYFSCQDGDGNIFGGVVEVGGCTKHFMLESLIKFSTKLLFEQPIKGLKWKAIKKVHVILVSNLNVFPGEDFYNLINFNSAENKFSLNVVNISSFELQKFSKHNFCQLSSNVELWAYFLKYAPSLKPSAHKKMKIPPIMKDAFELLVYSKWETSAKTAYGERLVLQESIANSIQKKRHENLKIVIAGFLIHKLSDEDMFKWMKGVITYEYFRELKLEVLQNGL